MVADHGNVVIEASVAKLVVGAVITAKLGVFVSWLVNVFGGILPVKGVSGLARLCLGWNRQWHVPG